jgi:plasmid replication initiation protein
VTTYGYLNKFWELQLIKIYLDRMNRMNERWRKVGDRGHEHKTLAGLPGSYRTVKFRCNWALIEIMLI